MKAIVSIIVPVYNAEQYIEDCIKSILALNFSAWELILVNDGSTDDSVKIIKKYSQLFPNVILIGSNENKGTMAARETGYLAAKGDFIFFCDSDDTLPTNALSDLYNCAIQTNADIVTGKFNNNKDVTLPYGDDSEGVLKAILNKYIPQNLWGKLIKSSLLKNREFIIPEKLINAEDAAMLFQIIPLMNKMSICNKIVYNYRKNPKSASHKTPDSYRENICKSSVIREQVLIGYPNLKNDARRYFQRNLRSFIFHKGGIALLRKYGLIKYFQIFQES